MSNIIDYQSYLNSNLNSDKIEKLLINLIDANDYTEISLNLRYAILKHDYDHEHGMIVQILDPNKAGLGENKQSISKFIYEEGLNLH